MMQSIVISLHNAPPEQAISASFGADGGTIGRAANNTLVLDDPERTVSRVHAQVVCRDGCFFLIDRGSNPTLYNGRVMGAGNEAPLGDGDRLMIGGFDLTVQVSQDTAAGSVPPVPPIANAPPADDDPFANLMDGLAGLPAAPPASQTLPVPNGVPDPSVDLLAPAPPVTPLAAQTAGDQNAPGDLSDLAVPISQGTPSIDSLFHSGEGGGLGGDPLAGSPLAEPLHRPNTTTAADPLAALAGNAAPPTPAPHSDHVPIGQFGFVPPQALAPGPAPSSAIPAATDLSTPVAPPPHAVAQPATSPALQYAGDAALLAALLRGLQRLDPVPRQLTPTLMERIGTLLRTATEGTLQLLLARQQFKQELRAERTMIATQDNNPLKFSPTTEVALAHLLGPGMGGFMPAEAAMRDAFNDLRAHQFGMMVGMRAALTQLIERFAPDQLEKKITVKSVFDHFFAAPRKARLWDRFVQLHAEIAAGTQEDFDGIFGKTFVQAYEEQMARLESAAEYPGRDVKR